MVTSKKLQLKRKIKFWILKKLINFRDHTLMDLISSWGMHHFVGVHPKNIFNYRSELFLDFVKPQDIILDVGCGTGLILFKIKDKIKSGLGLDFSEENLRICQEKHFAQNLNYQKGDWLNTDFPKIKNEINYTALIVSHVLEHIEDVPLFLKKVDAQKVLICVPSEENWYVQFKKYLGMNILSDPTHFREYTRELLTEELKKADYTVSNIQFNSEGEIFCVGLKQARA